MLLEVTQPQIRMQSHGAVIQFLLAQHDSQQGALAGPVTPDKPHLHIIRQSGLGLIEQHLAAVRFRRSLDLDQRCHFGRILTIVVAQMNARLPWRTL